MSDGMIVCFAILIGLAVWNHFAVAEIRDELRRK